MSDQVTGADRHAGPDRLPDHQPAIVPARPDDATARAVGGDRRRSRSTDTDSGFVTPEGLRALLARLAGEGQAAWASDSEAAELMRFCADRYQHLARKHHLSAHDAAVAAFEALRTPAVQRARNPWAVVTTAVERTLRAEARADELLCSRDRARRLAARTDLPSALRIGDPAAPSISATGEPAPWLELALANTHPEPASGDLDPATAAVVHQVRTATTNTLAVLAAVGWPIDVAGVGLEYITTALTEAGGVEAARQRLRKDRQPLAVLDVDRRTWTRLVAVVLGTPARDGLLHRLLAGDTPYQVIAEDAHDLTPPRHLNPQEACHVG